jgi:hypothetical protein
MIRPGSFGGTYVAYMRWTYRIYMNKPFENDFENNDKN